MKYSEKVALVPMENVAMLDTTSIPAAPPAPPPDPLLTKISTLDQKMRVILEDDKLSSEDKVREYGHVLDDYLLFSDKFYFREGIPTLRRVLPSTAATSSSPAVSGGEDIDIVRHTLETTLPKTLRKKSGLLLDYLKKGGVSWTQRGEISHEGESLEGSNLVDMVHHILRNRTKRVIPPVGIERFLDILKTINIPISLIAKPRGRKVIHSSPEKPPSSPYATPSSIGRRRVISSPVKKWSTYRQ